MSDHDEHIRAHIQAARDFQICLVCMQHTGNTSGVHTECATLARAHVAEHFRVMGRERLAKEFSNCE